MVKGPVEVPGTRETQSTRVMEIRLLKYKLRGIRTGEEKSTMLTRSKRVTENSKMYFGHTSTEG